MTQPDCTNDCARRADPGRSWLWRARVAAVETDDPFALGRGTSHYRTAASATRPASFQPVGGKRDVMRLSLRELHQSAPAPIDVIALPAGSPFGAVELNVEGCTFVSRACPRVRPGHYRTISNVQCCASPRTPACSVACARRPAREKVITLRPQIDFPRRYRLEPGAQGGRTVSLRVVRQTVWRQEQHRAGRGKTRRQALDVSEFGQAT